LIAVRFLKLFSIECGSVPQILVLSGISRFMNGRPAYPHRSIPSPAACAPIHTLTNSITASASRAALTIASDSIHVGSQKMEMPPKTVPIRDGLLSKS
jgi:hypothetical protein